VLPVCIGLGVLHRLGVPLHGVVAPQVALPVRPQCTRLQQMMHHSIMAQRGCLNSKTSTILLGRMKTLTGPCRDFCSATSSSSAASWSFFLCSSSSARQGRVCHSSEAS